MTLDDFKTAVLKLHPTAQFTIEDGSGETYGDVGSVTAHTGPDMQSDVVGVFVPDETRYCAIWNFHDWDEYDMS